MHTHAHVYIHDHIHANISVHTLAGKRKGQEKKARWTVPEESMTPEFDLWLPHTYICINTHIHVSTYTKQTHVCTYTQIHKYKNAITI